MDWETYWNHLITEKKLQNKVRAMDAIDCEKNGECKIKNICHDIYTDYKSYREELERVRKNFLEIIDTFPGVHLQTSRVKTLDSLLEKVITKRHQHLLDAENLYSDINGGNYKDILTDLVGIRLIISYRGKWIDLHNTIVERFPYIEDKTLYKPNRFIPHLSTGKGIIAEIPVVYYAYNDDIEAYEQTGIRAELREDGYRSIHYIISYQHTYIEIQVRTIYDEAWSDCDHLYVYKHEENKSHTALKELSGILCNLTNVSNELGDKMCDIFQEESIIEKDGFYQTEGGVVLQIQKIFDRINDTQHQFKDFMERLQG